MNGLATRLAATMLFIGACHGADDIDDAPTAPPLVVAVAPQARTIVRIPPALPAPEAEIERDTDEDVILDVDDRCPDIPEDTEGFDDIDGCPDPADYAVVTP
jgi:hypothetical protein